MFSKILSSIFFSLYVLHVILPTFLCRVTVYEAGYRLMGNCFLCLFCSRGKQYEKVVRSMV